MNWSKKFFFADNDLKDIANLVVIKTSCKFNAGFVQLQETPQQQEG